MAGQEVQHQSAMALFGDERHENTLRAEPFFDEIAELLGDALKGEGGIRVSQSPKRSQGPRDEGVGTLLAELIYREEPYEAEQIEYLLPRLYAYRVAAEWAP